MEIEITLTPKQVEEAVQHFLRSKGFEPSTVEFNITLGKSNVVGRPTFTGAIAKATLVPPPENG